MAGRPPPMSAISWLSLSVLLGAASLIAWVAVDLGLSRHLLDWQPSMAWSEPWRSFTASVIHLSPMHLGGNLLALALVAWLGMAAQMPSRCTWAWIWAIPLGHLGLLAQPDVLHYGGLSGVSHAGVAVVVTELLVYGGRNQRMIASALGTGLLAKIWSESPWGTGLRIVPGWDIAVVPWGHASGVLAGVVTTLVSVAWVRSTRISR